MMNTSHDAAKSIFYYDGPPTIQMGRTFTQCPRCEDTNAVSFQQLKDGGSESQLFGLEEVVKKHARSTFEVKSEGVKTSG